MAACLGGHARNDDHEAGHQDTRGLQHRPAPGGGGGVMQYRELSGTVFEM